MTKTAMIISIVCFLIVPVRTHAQFEDFLENIFSVEERGVYLDSLMVVQLEMIPDSPWEDDQPAAFRTVITNCSRRAVRVNLAIVDKDRVITQVSNATLEPGNNLLDFPETSIQFSRGEQRCFSLQTNIDHMWVPITMAKEFCLDRPKRDRELNFPSKGFV